MNAPGRHRETLAPLESAELGSVVFVRDYVQLVFEGRTTATLTAYTWPTLSHCADTMDARADGYCDSLCSFIGHSSARAEVEEGVEILVTFEDGNAIRVSLRQNDYDGPEAAMLICGGDIWVW